MMRIDAHQHFWQFDPVRDSWITGEMSVIQCDFLPDDLAPVLQRYALDGCVAVQADQSEKETEFLLDLSGTHEFIKGIVGWVDLRAGHLKERLNFYTAFPKLKGFRHIVQAEGPGFLKDPVFVSGVNKLAEFNYTYDLLIYHHQLEEAVHFVKNVPAVKIVVDHLAKPSIRTKEIREWSHHLKAIAAFGNVYCKISGMVTEADWSHWKKEAFTPYLDLLMETFGPGRLMYGSDWPVCLVAASYEEQLNIVESYISALSVSEKDAIMGDNAVKFYKL